MGVTALVSPCGSNTSPYDTWAKATSSVQTALNLWSSTGGNAIVMAAGVYGSGQTMVPPSGGTSSNWNFIVGDPASLYTDISGQKSNLTGGVYFRPFNTGRCCDWTSHQINWTEVKNIIFDAHTYTAGLPITSGLVMNISGDVIIEDCKVLSYERPIHVTFSGVNNSAYVPTIYINRCQQEYARVGGIMLYQINFSANATTNVYPSALIYNNVSFRFNDHSNGNGSENYYIGTDCNVYMLLDHSFGFNQKSTTIANNIGTIRYVQYASATSGSRVSAYRYTNCAKYFTSTYPIITGTGQITATECVSYSTTFISGCTNYKGYPYHMLVLPTRDSTLMSTLNYSSFLTSSNKYDFIGQDMSANSLSAPGAIATKDAISGRVVNYKHIDKTDNIGLFYVGFQKAVTTGGSATSSFRNIIDEGFIKWE